MARQKVNCASGAREAGLGHALLSASGSEKWLNCPPSAKLEAEIEEKSSEAVAGDCETLQFSGAASLLLDINASKITRYLVAVNAYILHCRAARSILCLGHNIYRSAREGVVANSHILSCRTQGTFSPGRDIYRSVRETGNLIVADCNPRHGHGVGICPARQLNSDTAPESIIRDFVFIDLQVAYILETYTRAGKIIDYVLTH